MSPSFGWRCPISWVAYRNSAFFQGDGLYLIGAGGKLLIVSAKDKLRASAGGKKVIFGGPSWDGAFAVAVSLVFAALGNGTGRMLSLLTFGSSE